MSDFKAQLKEQLAEVDWKDLIPHAQRDALIIVHPQLDLIEVGCAIALDDTFLVQNWISEQLIKKPSSEELSNWNEEPEIKFKTLIVQPFVIASVIPSI
ncbi:DUF2288 domain-containing protein [Cyanobacterium aponinum]|uniref:DUF2288 domain-containing protein n=2 Tax=Cyanobacterium aponinum TaxID=379064 RepID=K9YZN3_CYAAP|nr:DUF2288 domain-containing protein [Cyanobacterium aponinum]AFZ52374.1 Protein of unknown function DUF2288 [Cyanobacterium aponinum PCC 10605]MTF37704.1 DUF2288 family protein [Cyanobacterium aponinum 0216]